MARPRIEETEKRVKITVRIHPDLHAWVEERVGPGREFHSWTHAIERGLAEMQARESKGTPTRGSRIATSEK